MKLRLCLLILSAWLAPSIVQAQLARGTVVDASTGAPIHGAFVVLLNREGGRVAGMLTGAQGEFVFRAPTGRYSLRAERIGHSSATSAPFDLASEQTVSVRLQLEVAALRLKEISVRGEERCVGRPDVSLRTAEVWSEARKALEVTAFVERGAATFRSRSYQRDLDLDLKEVGAPEWKFSTTSGNRAFSAAPPDSLAKYGYVQSREGETFLYGPDAELLLSHSFLTQHCFRLERRNDRRGLLGLGFTQVRGRELPDIAGVLWLDEQTGALRFIEYGFTNLDHYADRRYAGGRTEFEQLPNGAWIVRRWYIRAPRLARTTGGTIRVIGTHEEGGEVLDAELADQPTATLVPRVSVEGFAFDSIRWRPLEGARVYLSGTPFKTVAGTAGKFQMDSIPAGSYYLAFAHPLMDSLPVYPAPRQIQLDSAVTRVDVAFPSLDGILAEQCPRGDSIRSIKAPQDTVNARRALLFGKVTQATGVQDTFRVRASWTEYTSASGRQEVTLDQIQVRPVVTEVTTDANGNYTLCDLPTDLPIRVEVVFGKLGLMRDTVRINATRLARHDIRLSRR